MRNTDPYRAKLVQIVSLNYPGTKSGQNAHPGDFVDRNDMGHDFATIIDDSFGVNLVWKPYEDLRKNLWVLKLIQGITSMGLGAILLLDLCSLSDIIWRWRQQWIPISLQLT